MKRATKWGVIILGLAWIAGASGIRAASPADMPGVPSRSFEFHVVVHVPALPAGNHELRIWMPLPYEERYQVISNVKIESPVRYRIYHESEYNNRYAYMVVDADKVKTPFDITLSFHAQRLEHRVALVPSGGSGGSFLVSTQRFLQPDRLVPIDGQIGELSDHETQGALEPLDKVRKIYDYVIASMHYDHDGNQWGRGDALWACDSHHGNCTDFHSLFIGMVRAQSIPARFEIGFQIPPSVHQAAITSYHCWAQFYIDSIGWIPIDASEAWKQKHLHDYYFGSIDQNRVMFSMGRDIRLNPPQQGDPLSYFVYPYAELDGKAFSGLTNDYFFLDAGASAAEKNSAAGGR